MNPEFKVLLIENEKEKRREMKKILNERFYSIDEAESLSSGFGKLSKEKYDMVVSIVKSIKSEKHASQFLKEFIETNTDKLKIPYIFFKTSRDRTECQDIEDTLSGGNFYFIDTDKLEYLHELEWAILNLEPKIFYKYSKNINQSLEEYKKTKEIAENLEKKTDKIQELEEEQEEIKKNYVQWKNIAESLGTLVGAFSLVMGIIISLVLLLSNKSFKLSEMKLYFVHILVIFFLISLIWGFILLLYFKLRSKMIIERMAKKYLESKANKLLEKKVNEILEKRNGKDND